ncbi:MAG: acylneuraminate cytidylyltransferase [Candidatus Cloacimonas sp. SDB]|nr:MAG: acylneuraminate cytidylyltransferase [Candidatus Cloacimonas sp. SDB]
MIDKIIDISENIAIIPARGQSKRIPRKNIRFFLGKPLIAYTIEAAIKSKLFSMIIVSTDSEEIAEISKKYGAEVPYLRDKNLSDDFCPVSLATLDVIEKLESESEKYTYVAQLMANCPLRDHSDIIDSYRQFIETDSASQISIMKYGWFNPWWAMECDEHHKLSPLFTEQLNKRSQDLPKLYCPTGAIWWAKVESLKKEKTFHTNNKSGWEISVINGIDIDTEEDWEIAELFMKYQRA